MAGRDLSSGRHGKIRWPTTVFEHQHAPAMPHGRIEIGFDHVVVLALGVQEHELGDFAFVERARSRSAVARSSRGSTCGAEMPHDLAAH